jgi:predicted Zn-ribbon and HTH transcriptional regulator
MAIVKNNYVKRDKNQKKKIKASLRYITHRPGEDNKRMYRELFGHDGFMTKDQAYRMFDEAKKGTLFFRLVISPDARREDTYKDLNMQAIAKKTIQHLEERLRLEGKLQFVAAVHSDHTNIRHIHSIVLVPRRLSKEEFKVISGLWQVAREEALRQRSQLDQTRAAQRQLQEPFLSKADELQVGQPLDMVTCQNCGFGQPMERLSRVLYRCPACDRIQSLSPNAGVQQSGASLQLSI